MAESRRIQALADSAVARLRLRAVIGVLNPRIDIEPPGRGRTVVAGPNP
jgi:hypothetical protein